MWAASAALSTLQLAGMTGFALADAAPFNGRFWLAAAAAAAIANGAICGFVRSTTCVITLVVAGAIAISPFVRRTCPFFIDAAPGGAPVMARAAATTTRQVARVEVVTSANGLRQFSKQRGRAERPSTTDEQCRNPGDEPSRGNSVSILAALGLATLVPSALAGLAGDGFRLVSSGLARLHRRRFPDTREP